MRLLLLKLLELCQQSLVRPPTVMSLTLVLLMLVLVLVLLMLLVVALV